MSSNLISGSFPDKLSQTPDLASIYFDNNVLTGPLPPSLSNSTSLVTLHISNNSLTGPIAFPLAQNLTQIYAQRNQFSGTLSFESNGALQKIAVDYNLLTGAVPDFKTLTGLQLFTAAGNQLTGSVLNLNSAPNLIKLSVPSHPSLFPTDTIPPPSVIYPKTP